MRPRIKYYEEAPIFDAFTRYDEAEGRLVSVPETEFRRIHSGLGAPTRGTAPGIERYDGGDVVLFRGETSPVRTRFPRRVYFQITHNCQLSCPYCFLKAGPGEAHVPTSAVLALARFLARNGLIEVRLTGGEPTSHPDFLCIADAFHDLGVYVSVATHGVLNRSVLDALSLRPWIWLICSIDGDAATHDRYRCGTHSRVIGNLLWLRNHVPGLRLRLTTVLTRRNQRQIGALAETARSVGAESVTIIPLRPQLRDPSLREEMITAAEFREVLEQIAATTRETGVRMTTTLATDFAPQMHPDPLVRKRTACAAGREATNLDFDSRTGRFLLYGCSYSPAPDRDAPQVLRRPFLAGEFHPGEEDALFDIWRRDECWAIYRDDSFKSDACQNCSYLRDLRCVGSCPIQNIDFRTLDVDQALLDQLRSQLSSTAEWYCYQRVLST